MRPLKAIQVVIRNSIANPFLSSPLQDKAYLVMNTYSGCLESQQTERDRYKELPKFDPTVFQPSLLENYSPLRTAQAQRMAQHSRIGASMVEAARIYSRK